MRLPIFAAAILAAFIPALAPPAAAHEIGVGSITLTDLWSRATPPGAPTAAGYFTITNNGAEPDRLIGASTPGAAEGQLHAMAVTDGVMTMKQIDGIDIPAGGSVTLESGQAHVMFVGLKQPFVAGEEVPITLTFEKAGTLETFVHVIPIGAIGLDGTTSEDHEGH